MLTAHLKINGRDIGELRIINDKTGSPQIGNYEWTLTHYSDKGDLLVKKDGALAGFNRKDGAWALVKNILKEAL